MCDSKGICGLVITMSDDRILFNVNAYLPCDNYHVVNVYDDVKDVVNDIEMTTESVSPDNEIRGGDLNIDFQCYNGHSIFCTHQNHSFWCKTLNLSCRIRKSTIM